MLNDHDQRELGLITAGLADDRRLVRMFGAADPARPGTVRARVLAGFGILVLVIGALCADGGLVLQGILVAGAGAAWAWLRIRRAGAAGGSPAAPSRRLAAPPD